MKKLSVLSMALVAFGAVSAMASVRVGEDVRLELRNQAKQGITSSINTTVVRVLADGRVYREELAARETNVVSHEELVGLSVDQMDRIENLIGDARGGKVETDFHQIHCMAMSLTEQVLTADNGKVFLSRGSMCQDPTLNVTKAAKELAGILVQASQNAAISPGQAFVVCQNYPLMADAGYEVSISGESSGNGYAQLSEQNFAGARVLGNYNVRGNFGSAVRVFKGNGFRLAINMKNPMQGGFMSKFTAKTAQGTRVSGSLICSFPVRAL